MQPSEAEIVITVADDHALVCRNQAQPDGSVRCERAVNAEALETAAIDAIVADDHPFIPGHQYACPPELAEQADWRM